MVVIDGSREHAPQFFAVRMQWEERDVGVQNGEISALLLQAFVQQARQGHGREIERVFGR